MPFTVSAPVQADKTGPAIVEIQKELKGYLGDKGITKTEFDRSVISAIRRMAGQYETAGSVLGAMQSNDFMRRGDDYQEQLAKKYRALTIPQVDAAARAAIDPAKLVWVVVGDAAKGFDDHDFALELMESEGVLVVPGSSFNVPYRNHFRVTLLPEPADVREVFTRIERVLDRHAERAQAGELRAIA